MDSSIHFLYQIASILTLTLVIFLSFIGALYLIASIVCFAWDAYDFLKDERERKKIIKENNK